VRRYGRVVLGGTFDRFHVGHEALLRTAFELGRSVAIGLTSRAFLSAHPKPGATAIASEASRRASLRRWLRRHYPSGRWTIVPIDDRLGGAVDEGVDALVVSADTVGGGRAVNRERARRGRAPVPLVVVPLVLADDLEPLSSRRIRAGEVDRDGHRRSPIEVGLVAAAADRPAAARGVRRAFPRARVSSPRTLRTRGSGPAALRRLARQARGRRALGVAVVRDGRAGWKVAVGSRRVVLVPRRIGGSSPRDLAEGLTRVLRASPPKRL
jgi:pantetheine-phosphate adenylyltransferase